MVSQPSQRLNQTMLVRNRSGCESTLEVLDLDQQALV